MSAAAIVTSPIERTLRFYDTTAGKKTVMAVTGVILFGFVAGHLAGNLQVFLGREKINHYAVFLRSLGELLWVARGVLLLSVILHIATTLQLVLLKQKARPVSYQRKRNIGSSYASRTMYWSGPIVACFILYHLLHLTFGVVHPDFREQAGLGAPDAYDNIVNGFRQIPAAIAYIVGVSLLCLHLFHGLYSMFQTLGAAHPRYTPLYRAFAAVAAIVIAIGYLSIPIAVLTGLIGSELNATRV